MKKTKRQPRPSNRYKDQSRKVTMSPSSNNAPSIPPDDLVDVGKFLEGHAVIRGSHAYLTLKAFARTKSGIRTVTARIADAVNLLHRKCIEFNRGLSAGELSELTGIQKETLRINLTKMKEIGLVRSYKERAHSTENGSERKRGRREIRWTTKGCLKPSETP